MENEMTWFDETALKHISEGNKNCKCLPCISYRNSHKQKHSRTKAINKRVKTKPSWDEWFAKHETPDQMD
jgi:hypothetical protein